MERSTTSWSGRRRLARDTGIRRTTVTVDDVVQSDGTIRLVDDGQVHQVRIDVNASDDTERHRLAYVGQRTDRTGTTA